MDLPFLRNQIELKFEELKNALQVYQDELDKNFDPAASVMTKEEVFEISELIKRFTDIKENIAAIAEDFEIDVLRLGDYHTEMYRLLNLHAKEQRAKLSLEYEGVLIERRPLKYSGMADSAGYDVANKQMDISYKTGGVYRYYNVPESFYESIITRKSFKGLKEEIAQYEFAKIQ
jgi:hypothetical protein